MLKSRTNHFAALVVLAGLLGGGGIAYGLSNLVVQLAAIALLALHRVEVGAFFAKAPRLLTALVIASLALPLLQLVPLPPTMWKSLPGRELVQESLALGHVDGWFALSLNSARTFVAFLGLIAPATVIIIGLGAERRAIDRATLVWVGLGLLCVAIGGIEILRPSGQSVLYPEGGMKGVLFGLLANRNSTGVFLVCCLLLLAAMPAAARMSGVWLIRACAAVLLAVGVVLTQSRTSMVLLGLPLGLMALRFLVDIARSRTSRTTRGTNAASSVSGKFPLVAGLAIVLLAAAIGTAGIAPMTDNSRIGTSLSRFSNSDEQRPLIWEDARYAAQRYWWAGSGMGTFDEVFQVDEALEHISPRRAGRAHNDYLEVAIEAGIVGLGLIAAWIVWALFASFRALRNPDPWPALSGLGILAVVALQSAFDYPLRNQTMLCMAAFAVLLLARGSAGAQSGARGEVA
ncbi:MAG: hypothetical protein RIS85_2637 [Pseudomonadota bacterium]